MVLEALNCHRVIMGQGAHQAAVAGDAANRAEVCYLVLDMYKDRVGDREYNQL